VIRWFASLCLILVQIVGSGNRKLLPAHAESREGCAHKPADGVGMK
jgi:hypothetical protein